MNTKQVPIMSIKQMNDEEWQQLATRNAMQNYYKAFGEYPENPAAALEWQRGCVLCANI